MHCDQFLPWLETGGLRATLAQRHARQCASCRAAAAMLEQVKAELAAGERMPTAIREAFLGAAELETGVASVALTASPEAGEFRSRWWAALAASIVVAAASWAAWEALRPERVARPGDPAPRPAVEQVAEVDGDVRRVGPITVTTVDSATQLADLEREVALLAATLTRTTADAERLAVQQAVERVLANHERTFARN